MVKVLHLTLEAQHFYSIAAGIKKEEYREIKKYWIRRLFDFDGMYKEFDEIHFRNGYHSDSPFMRVECKGICVKPVKGKNYYTLKLGEVLEIKNCRHPDQYRSTHPETGAVGCCICYKTLTEGVVFAEH